MTEETTKPKRTRKPATSGGAPRKRKITFTPPPGIAAEVERLHKETRLPLVTITEHLAEEAEELLAPMAGQVRAIVGRRMGFLPTPPAADAVPNGKAEE